MDKKNEDYVYKFSSTVCEDPTGLRAFGLIKKLVNKSKLSDDTDDGFDGWKHKDEKGNHTIKLGYDRGLNDYSLFKELFHYESYKNGIIKQMGWIFNFRPFFKRSQSKEKVQEGCS